MAVASVYKPMRKKVVVDMKNEIPIEIVRCIDSDGKYVLVKRYEAKRAGRKHHRSSPFPLVRFEQVICKLDMPAKYELLPNIDLSASPILNKNYQIQTINYYLNKQSINEYELRNLIMAYLKSKRKEMDKDKFKIVCLIFDKADKMLGRADCRKNSSRNEADVSYKFLIKSYKKIVGLCEVKKKVADKKVRKDGSLFMREIYYQIFHNSAMYTDCHATFTTIIIYKDGTEYEVPTRLFRQYMAGSRPLNQHKVNPNLVNPIYGKWTYTKGVTII